MSDAPGLEAFIGKWRDRWPEWNVAEVFVPMQEREVATAWFALLQELTDAAWAGGDPRPGEAKLGWWMEELHGWSQRRRRHPLGQVLQPLPAPWNELGAQLPALLMVRDAAVDQRQADELLVPVGRAVAVIADALFSGPSTPPAVAPLLARHLLLRGDAAAPLSLRARLGDAQKGQALAACWATQLLDAWVDRPGGTRATRVFDALLRGRLEQAAAGRASQPLGRLPALWRCWRAARV